MSTSSPVTVAQRPRSPFTSGSVVVGIFAVVVLAVGLGTAAYLKLTPHPIAIEAILADLHKYDGQSVRIQGTVQESTNLLGTKWYRVKDDSASMIVVTQRGLPKEGDFVIANGQVKQVFKLGDLTETVLLEGPADESGGK